MSFLKGDLERYSELISKGVLISPESRSVRLSASEQVLDRSEGILIETRRTESGLTYAKAVEGRERVEHLRIEADLTKSAFLLMGLEFWDQVKFNELGFDRAELTRPFIGAALDFSFALREGITQLQVADLEDTLVTLYKAMGHPFPHPDLRLSNLVCGNTLISGTSLPKIIPIDYDPFKVGLSSLVPLDTPIGAYRINENDLNSRVSGIVRVVFGGNEDLIY